jgi:hypothetical protein
MTLTQIKERYTGIQTKLKTIDTDGCLFLCLCSIIEEVTNAPADIIGIIQLSKKRGWLSDEFTVNDSLELLRAFTGKIWKRTEPKKLPEIIKDNEFSIEVWQKPNSKAKHFKRRFTDTLINSQTVKIGSITEYYIYSY